MKKIISVSLFILSMGLVGCGELPINVEMVDAEVVRIGTETLDIRNCDSTEDMVTTLATHAPVRQQITIADTATSEKTGSAIEIPSDIVDELKTQIENVYQAEFEAALGDAEQVSFTIPGDKIHMYKIFWIQQNYSSTMSFSIDRQLCTVSYEYTLETPELDSLTTMSCTA